MSLSSIIVLLVVLVLFGLIAVIALRIMRESQREKERNQSLRNIGRYESAEEAVIDEDKSEQESTASSLAKIKKKKSKEPTVEELLFMAGKLSQSERQAFYKRRKLAPLIGGLIGLGLGLLNGDSTTILILCVAGVLLGLIMPMRMLRGWVKEQHEELSYYLPLMIEQISIGVSSSLDIGPCIAQLVEMADERNSHNATTDLLKYALFYVKSGVGLEEALVEIGRASGQHDFSQTLMALAQVAKFGGEVSKQLQELAETVSSQREAKIESSIRQLELKATGPVSMVFLAFVMLLGLGIAAQIMAGMDS
jgi:Flp pilus assembly protein TadB